VAHIVVDMTIKLRQDLLLVLIIVIMRTSKKRIFLVTSVIFHFLTLTFKMKLASIAILVSTVFKMKSMIDWMWKKRLKRMVEKIYGISFILRRNHHKIFLKVKLFCPKYLLADQKLNIKLMHTDLVSQVN
jgi:hypothetical protein